MVHFRYLSCRRRYGITAQGNETAYAEDRRWRDPCRQHTKSENDHHAHVEFHAQSHAEIQDAEETAPENVRMNPTVQIRKLSDFTRQRQNANRHTARGMSLLSESMTEDGYVAPITTAADGEVIDGSARLETAAATFTDDETLVIQHDGRRPIVMQRTDIATADDPQAMRISLRANRIGELNLAWDKETLARVSQDFELPGLWTDEELQTLQEVGTSDPGDPFLASPLPSEPIPPAVARQTLAQRFIIPPFSVLDARQGYWQDRKRAWLALGIQSELGRGNNNLTMSHPATTATIDFYAQKRKLEAEAGQALSTDETKARLATQGVLKDHRAANRRRQETEL